MCLGYVGLPFDMAKNQCYYNHRRTTVAWASRIKASGGKNMIVALAEHQLVSFRQDVEKAHQAGKDFLLPVRVPPKGLGKGSRCYVSSGGRLHGYVKYVDVVPLEKQELLLGREISPGWYVVLRGPLKEMDGPSPLRGAAAVGSYRYCEDL